MPKRDKCTGCGQSEESARGKVYYGATHLSLGLWRCLDCIEADSRTSTGLYRQQSGQEQKGGAL